VGVDLKEIRLVDEHCHAVAPDAGEDAATWRRWLTESGDPRIQGEAVTTTVFYRRMVRDLAELLGCGATEEEVLAARRALGPERALARLWADAGIETALVDTGFPGPGRRTVAAADVTRLTGVGVRPILRLEPLMADLILAHPTLEAAAAALRAVVAGARDQGYVGLKSVAAYRTGLDIQEPARATAVAAYSRLRTDGQTQGSLRLADKAVLDALLLEALREAARQGLPIQFHTGYGDTDADLRLANPLHLRWLLEQADLRDLPIVLLHEAYPFTREAAVLASLYGNVYLDLSYGIPFLGAAEMAACTRAALAVAPGSRLVYSSDGAILPEIHWASAKWGRRLIGAVLDNQVASGEIDAAQAAQTARAVLRDNAIRLYGL